jgi:hypothetical protein
MAVGCFTTKAANLCVGNKTGTQQPEKGKKFIQIEIWFGCPNIIIISK